MSENRIEELYGQYAGGMEDWQIKLAIARIMYFKLPQEVWQDTMQELAVVVLEFRYDAEKAHAASEKTILCRLMDNQIRMLARSNARRQAMQERLSEMSQSEEDMHSPDDSATEGELQHIVAMLTPLQQEICRGLMDGMSICQIAVLTGRHYTTIRRQAHKIAALLALRGFES